MIWTYLQGSQTDSDQGRAPNAPPLPQQPATRLRVDLTYQWIARGHFNQLANLVGNGRIPTDTDLRHPLSGKEYEEQGQAAFSLASAFEAGVQTDTIVSTLVVRFSFLPLCIGAQPVIA